ncbi:lipid II flippase MurJ [Methylocaldum szegediense]|uniref:Virulence factor MVIN family protein n=2 Tax=Methylocaldum szegediense TaxID=73780 RepID=A0ABN8WZN3_9GAMM|nr:lipid II flippase MurJ [Methylocaldum szegediense]CAI8719378.1 conserved membrane protein of unknown function [Methylocaldum szegediense]
MNIGKNPKAETLLGAVWSSVFWKGLDRLASLVKHIFIASAIGLSAELDVFYMATGLLGVLVLSWSGIIDILAVPELVQYDRSGNQARFQALAGGLFSLCLLFSVILALSVYASWDIWTRLAFGFTDERETLLKEAIPWLLPLLFLYIPVRFLGALHRARRNFSLFYQSEFIISLVILFCVIFFTKAPRVLLWSYSLGISVSFLFLFLPSLRVFRPWGNPFGSEVKALLPLLPGLWVLSGIFYVYELVQKQFVSLLHEGAVGAIAYAWTLVRLPSVLMNVGGAFITVYAENRSNPEKIRENLDNLISVTITVTIPISIILFFFGQDFVGLVLERGLFSRTDTETVGEAVAYFSLAMVPLALISPLEQVFRVERKLRLIVRRLLAGLMLFVVFCLYFVVGHNMGIKGIALATSLSYWGMLLSSLHGIIALGIQISIFRHLRWAFIVMSLGILAMIPGYWIGGLANSYWLLLPQSITILGITILGASLFHWEDGALIRELVHRSLFRWKPKRAC